MANLEGMPIGSLPEATSIQDEDEIVVYRPSTGKAYQANTDLIDSLSDFFKVGETVNGDLDDLLSAGKYQASSGTYTNGPEDRTSGCAIFVIELRSSRILAQVWIGALSSLPIFIRYYTSGQWYSWIQML